MQMPLEVKKFWLGEVQHYEDAVYATFLKLDSTKYSANYFLVRNSQKLWQTALQAWHTKSLTL